MIESFFCLDLSNRWVSQVSCDLLDYQFDMKTVAEAEKIYGEIDY